MEIERRYCTPLSDGTWSGAKTLAAEFGVSAGTIYHHLERQGIPRRSTREAFSNGKRTKPITHVPTGAAPACKCGCGALTAWNRRKNRWNRYLAGHYRRDAPYKHRDWLVREYIDNNRTVRELADECGVEQTAVHRQMRLLGVPRRDASAAHRGRQAGAANPAWKGGVTPERQRMYKTPEWKAALSAVFARDDYRCVRCGAGKTRRNRLHAHHVTPWADAPELRTEMANLVTLCNDCHLWVHSRANALSAFLAQPGEMSPAGAHQPPLAKSAD